MAEPGLSALQRRVVTVLSGMEPPWTLTGGAALVGYHLAHRTTRDLDLFWHGRSSLGEAPREVIRRLEAAGLTVARIQSTPAFVRLDVADEDDRVMVDLVADPVAVIEEPTIQPDAVLVDTAHEILVNKLTALLSRSELRDLEDVRALVTAGGDLERALGEASQKDAGFSSLTLAWTLRQTPLQVASALGFDAEALELFRDELIAILTRDKPMDDG